MVGRNSSSRARRESYAHTVEQAERSWCEAGSLAGQIRPHWDRVSVQGRSEELLWGAALLVGAEVDSLVQELLRSVRERVEPYPPLHALHRALPEGGEEQQPLL